MMQSETKNERSKNKKRSYKFIAFCARAHLHKKVGINILYIIIRRRVREKREKNELTVEAYRGMHAHMHT